VDEYVKTIHNVILRSFLIGHVATLERAREQLFTFTPLS